MTSRTLVRLRKAGPCLATLTIATLALAGAASADAIFQSASGSDAMRAAPIGDGAFVGTRFTIDRPYDVTSIIANLVNFDQDNPHTVFLALNPLTAASGFPSSTLSGPLFTATITLPVSDFSRDFAVSTGGLVLPSGSYAITVGTGLFGAPGSNNSYYVHAEEYADGAGGGGDYVTDNNVFAARPQDNISYRLDRNSGRRFLVNGTAVAVPESPSPALLALGLLPLRLFARRRESR